MKKGDFYLKVSISGIVVEAFHKVVEIKEGKTNHLEMWVGHTLVMIIGLWVYFARWSLLKY